MKKILLLCVLVSMIVVCNSFAEEVKSQVGLTLEQLMFGDLGIKSEGVTVYGYMNTNLQKTLQELSIDNAGNTKKTDQPFEWSTPYIRLFFKTPIGENVDTFVNLGGESVEVRNMWGNIKLYDWLQFRMGKIYRDFDLFNSRLDEVPAYVGIEPPELFDNDHLMLPRLTTFMVRGEKEQGAYKLSYSVSTDNGEGGPLEDVLPMGFDVRATIKDKAIFGVSAYFSSIGSGKSVPEVSVGNGPPTGGILPWMANDKYKALACFLETQISNLFIQTGLQYAEHDATRDPASVLTVINNTSLTATQRERFLGANSTLANAALNVSHVVTNGSYLIQSGYVRFGYNVPTRYGLLIPYLFFDWMYNPEVIGKKKYGGDNECGIADDGIFYKPTLGVSYKPKDQIAIQLDTSTHVQKFNGKTDFYPEVRCDVSFMFK